MDAIALQTLDQLGAISKPFEVKSIGLSGWVVRFDDDQRGADGLIASAAVEAIDAFSRSTSLLLELRSTRLDAGDCRRILTLNRLAGLDLAGAEGTSPLLDGLSRLNALKILDIGLAPRDAKTLTEAAKLPTLVRLCLSRAELDDEALDVLGSFSNLKELFIDGHRASPASLARLQEKLSSCRIVS